MREAGEKLPHDSLLQDKRQVRNGLVAAPHNAVCLPPDWEGHWMFHQVLGQSMVVLCLYGLCENMQSHEGVSTEQFSIRNGQIFVSSWTSVSSTIEREFAPLPSSSDILYPVKSHMSYVFSQFLFPVEQLYNFPYLPLFPSFGWFPIASFY